MAAAGFLALAHTFKSGEHIRVTLLLSALPAKGSLRLDIFALLVACLIAGNLCWFSGKLVLDSYAYNDISTSRSEEHTSELQSLMRISYAVFCLKKKKTTKNTNTNSTKQYKAKQNI